MVGSLEIPIDLRAEKALRERVRRIAGYSRGAPVFHGHQRRTRIRAVVGARASNNRRARMCVRAGMRPIPGSAQLEVPGIGPRAHTCKVVLVRDGCQKRGM